MILYDYYRSSAAYRVRIALNLKAIDYQQVPVNLVAGEQRSAAHLARNPQGLVPALLDGELLLTQSMAICEYLDETYPQVTPLLPAASADRAKVRAMALLVACDIHPLNNLRVLKYLLTELGGSDTQKTQWYQHWVYQGFDALESMLAVNAGAFSFGDQLSLADVSLIPQVFNANRFNCDMSRYPHICRVNDNCLQLKGFIDAHPDRQGTA
ncbi:maleylacetoacetate isomerase [Amphritea sp. 1_MG-2023]|uniref:maleylacetoacetate isomerase n=1 Tax=Amphritea sp. 1_MG-2023 TaxID=3062670 RepID=UPI0026E1C458|nr:maleylacetoacetate isomerase [Amphritea sp. 1_MG-2023]MDO6562466.1 maleylacetoacetate isomerase [Amphritea sp. 1_MG-2023]